MSPGVLARPAIQDAVLGTCLQLLGPGELSYIGQAAAVYPVLDVEPRWVALRPQALVLEAHQAEKLEESGLTLADLLGDRQGLDRALAERRGRRFRGAGAAAVSRRRSTTCVRPPSPPIPTWSGRSRRRGSRSSALSTSSARRRCRRRRGATR